MKKKTIGENFNTSLCTFVESEIVPLNSSKHIEEKVVVNFATLFHSAGLQLYSFLSKHSLILEKVLK